MDYFETCQGATIRVLLTAEELQFPALDSLCEKVIQWSKISKTGARKTRQANHKADQLYDEIMAFKTPPIKLKPLSPQNSVCSTNTSHSEDIRPIAQSLRPRSVNHKPLSSSSTRSVTPSTPIHQRLRAHLKNTTPASVLGTALSQGHPKVSVTKIRQLLKSDSAQKKRDEEKERQARLIQERKAKEERAEAQKKQLLEERAENAKLNREKRLNHAAELRKAREVAKSQQKPKEKAKVAELRALVNETKAPVVEAKAPVVEVKSQVARVNDPQPPEQVHRLNETFKKPADDTDNIEIKIQDETQDETQEVLKDNIPKVAAWARAPHLREALMCQFSKSYHDRQREVLKIFCSVPLPVELETIFSSMKPVNARYLCRTSSAVWSPPNRAIKRTSSMVETPKK